jgi:hypothetical protein
MKQFRLFTFLLFLCPAALCQSVTGYWYGTANLSIEGVNDNYMIELVVKQNGANVKGILNYYFKNQYRSLPVTGYYNAATRQVSFANIPVTYFGSVANKEVDCYMNLNTLLRVSQAGSLLNGKFTGAEGYRYTCPELALNLRLNNDANNLDSIATAIKEFKEVNQVWRPSATDTQVAVVVQPRKVTNYVVDNEFLKRENIIANEIEVESDSVQVDFYDNGDVDGDSIAIFLNSKLIAYRQRLSTKAIHFTFPLDTLKKVNEIAMFAENLGAIPPNTALMVISDGRNRFEVRMSSSLDKNAVLRIKRKKSGLKVKG